MVEDLKGLTVSIRQDDDGCTAVLKPEFAVNGSRVIKQDASGKWITMNGAHVLIKGGKFINGPFAGQATTAGGKYFTSSGNVKMPAGHRAAIVSACADAEENGSSTLYMDNYKVDIKKQKDFPKDDKYVVVAHNIIQGTGNGRRDKTVTKHAANEVGDRLVELRSLVKPKVVQVATGGKLK